MGQISADIRFRPSLSIIPALSVFFSGDEHTTGPTVRECHCAHHVGHMLQI